ncbi:hypothetical protein INT43_003336 [Umbelopsis isabellina]|uniref:DUF221-domain-containing protein n=1 Tax=Mortierella isabellina TaxID=91625 RepID=A0A8H7PQ28_MORIS|nr:hypothetical protein INT43_003336 [Umbelopsis isabellina]
MSTSLSTAFSGSAALSGSASQTSIGTVLTTVSPMNSSTLAIPPSVTSTLQTTTSSVVAAAATSSSNPSPYSPECILNWGSGCNNVSGTFVSSAQNVSGLTGQLIICASLVNIVSAAKKYEKLPDSFFGWIIPLIRVSQEEVLDKVGLDAVVMLQFLALGFKMFSICSFFGVTVLVPITVKTGNITAGDPQTLSIVSMTNSSNYLIPYLVFTYVFCLVAFWLMYRNYGHYVALRRRYMIRHKNSLQARSVMVTGIPRHMQTDQKLAEYFEDLGLGPVESAHVVRYVKTVRSTVAQRSSYLRSLETYYAKYWGNPCEDPHYDPDTILDEADNEDDQDQAVTAAQKSTVPYIVKKRKRPTTRTGFLGLFGEKVDAIDYYTRKFIDADDKVMELRSQKNFQTSSVGFVTFETIVGATLASQVLIDGVPFRMRTKLAKEPRDIYWKSILIPGRQRIFREFITYVLLLALIVFWTVPVSFFSTLTSPQTLSKIIPSLANNHNAVVQAIVQGILPPLAVNIFMALLPLILDALGELQGISSRSALAEATLSKFFFFQIFNVLLVFTIASTLSKTLQDIIQNPSAVANLLATTLPQVAPFFINYVILQGILLMPLNLLLIGALIVRGFNYLFLCKTPRDYAEARAPQNFMYGWSYPTPLLMFVVVLEYSTVAPLILLFGTVYFAMAFLVYKYQLLYVYFHPYETAGAAWPMIFPRIITGMIIFQLTMTGLFFLKRYITLGALCIPLIVITIIYKVAMDKAYYKSTKALPLHFLKEEMMTLPTHDISEHEETDNRRSSRRSSMMSFNSVFNRNRPSDAHSTKSAQQLEISKQASDSPKNVGEGDNQYAEHQQELARKASRLRKKVVLEFDDYEAVADKSTDYRQPPQSLNNGILDTGLRRYGNPALVGVMPQLWLPVKANPGSSATPRRSHAQRLKTASQLTAGLSKMVKRAESARRAVSGKTGTVRRPRRKPANVVENCEVPRDAHQPLVSSTDLPADTAIDMISQKSTSEDAPTTYPTIKFADEAGISGTDQDDGPRSVASEKEHTAASVADVESDDSDPESDADANAPEIHKTYYHHPEKRHSTYTISSSNAQ